MCSCSTTRPGDPVIGSAFSSAEDAWFWTMGSLRARREGTSRSGGRTQRPCDPDDVIRCLDRLYRNRRIDLAHAQVLRVWGERCLAPDRGHNDSRDAKLWKEAMDRLAPLLRQKGIVA